MSVLNGVKPAVILPGAGRGIILFGLLLLLASCGARDEQDPLAAQVGGAHISRMELAKQYGFTGSGDSTASLTAEQLRDAAEKWAWRQILIQEAKRRRLDQDPQFRRRLEELRDQLLIKMLYQSETDDIRVSDIEIQQEYNRHPDLYVTAHDQIDLIYIIAPSRKKARSARAALQSGKELSEILTADRTLKGEALGWVEEDDLIPEIASAAFALVPGGFSTPLKFGENQYIVLYCRQRRSAGTRLPLAEVSETIESNLLQNKRREAEKKLRDELWITYNPHIFPASGQPDTSNTPTEK